MSVETVRIVNPLPGRYFTREPGVGGTIKARPEDFLVEELPRYEPCGEGEHLYLRIEKRGVSHAELLAVLRKHFGVRDNAIGAAGMKDKHAVTRQTISVHLPGGGGPPTAPPHDRITLLWADRHRNKLRLGHLAGNRFSIRIRDVDPTGVTVVRRVLEELRRRGVPNYFGGQRFGYRANNHLLGRALLRGDWTGLLAELLGTGGSPFPEYQRARRELFDGGRYAEAAGQWTPADRNELVVAKALASGRPPRDAVRAVGRSAMKFWVSALQSAVFNRVVDRRLDEQMLTTLVEGDLAYRHDNGSVFSVTADELASGALAGRVRALEVSPSGPLWAAGMIRAGGAVDVAEREALSAADVEPQRFESLDPGLKGARRPLRVPVADVETEAGVDGHGAFIRVAFDLPSGSYATVLLRELMKADAPPDAAP